MEPLHKRFETLEANYVALNQKINNIEQLFSTLTEMQVLQKLENFTSQLDQLLSRLDQLEQIYPVVQLPEGWLHPQFSLRIKAPKELVMTTIGIQMKAWFDLNLLPVVLQNDGFIYLYCNEILEPHKPVLLSLQETVQVENLVNNEIIILDINSI